MSFWCTLFTGGLAALQEIALTRTRTVLLGTGFGGLCFVFGFTLLGFLVPGYSATRDTISALELTPLGWAQRVNFVCFGGSLLGFTLALKREMGDRRGASVVAALQTLSGFGVIGAGLFALPPLHLVSDLVAFNSALAVLLVFAWSVGNDQHCRAWAIYSAATALAMICFLAAFGILNHTGGPAGLLEKMATAVRAVWSAAFVVGALRRNPFVGARSRV